MPPVPLKVTVDEPAVNVPADESQLPLSAIFTLFVHVTVPLAPMVRPAVVQPLLTELLGVLIVTRAVPVLAVTVELPVTARSHCPTAKVPLETFKSPVTLALSCNV